ncbi:acidic partial [Plasmopara halstedii]|uniref:Acidic partial n=1 Tax=Plasmopara halstedii TaxID=4781 RepID=A0A0P1B633_PLAHL|nr:acidic partial [Plasmopara halstedii]CEG49911.1 acidic partial [Plasmopara halstedii]
MVSIGVSTSVCLSEATSRMDASQLVTDNALSSFSTSPNFSSFTRFLDQKRFQELFPNAIELYDFNSLVNAAKRFPQFANTGNDVKDKLELAAFLAQTAHESDNFRAAEEYGHENYSISQYCDNTTYPCARGLRYHGRGPIQLSWNYNYFNAGNALGLDLLNHPELVSTDSIVAWMTALWFWMTPQNGQPIHDVVTCVNGFAKSTQVINGGLECGPNAINRESVLQRSKYYLRMCDALGVDPLGNNSSDMCTKSTY